MSNNKFVDLLTTSGLYSHVPITRQDHEQLYDFLFDVLKIDVFCPECRCISTYIKDQEQCSPMQRTHPGIPYASTTPNPCQELIDDNRNVFLVFTCARNHKHNLRFALALNEETMVKYGQNPAHSDLQDAPYGKALDKGYYKEMKRAHGLYSHGVGIGSFVYLRRIFEHLILKTYNESPEPKLEFSKFMQFDMKEKIAALREHLPETLVDNRAIYSILSKGIHELTEEQCLKMFPVVYAGIEIILDELLARAERTKKRNALSKAIAQLSQSL